VAQAKRVLRGLNGVAGAALDSKDRVAEILPVAISTAAMVEEKGWLSGIGILEPDEQFSALDCLGALLAVFQFKHLLRPFFRQA
jgi:hypothetical protein